MIYRAVLFDFDYTLADSSVPIVDCFNTALRALGLEEAPEEAICRTIGLALPEALAAVAGEEARCRAEEFRGHWRRRSDEVMVAGTRMVPAAPAALRSLHGLGFDLAVVSTKYRARIIDVLEREGLASLFTTIVGGDDVAEPKPDPEGLLIALERLGAPPAQALYVGDSETDGRTAQRAGVHFAAVTSGCTPQSALARYQPRAILADVGELPHWLGNATGERR